MVKVLQFRVEESDADLLREAAWQARVSLSEWLRRTCLDAVEVDGRGLAEPGASPSFAPVVDVPAKAEKRVPCETRNPSVPIEKCSFALGHEGHHSWKR